MFRLRLAVRLGVAPHRLGELLTAEEYHQLLELDAIDNAQTQPD